MKVYWLEQSEADVPAKNDWLSANEAACLGSMRFPKRRADWRLGRWTAKCALSAYLDVHAHPEVFKKMDIRPAPSGAPEAFFNSQPATVTISLSHRFGIAACAVATSGVAMGCDLEMVEPRSDAFVENYFTVEEQALVAHASASDRPRLLSLLWSGKESALKALRAGLRLDTRCVTVSPSAASSDVNDWGAWGRLSVRYATGRSGGEGWTGEQIFHGWWQHAGNVVRTVVAAPPPGPPIPLKIPAHLFDCASRLVADRMLKQA